MSPDVVTDTEWTRPIPRPEPEKHMAQAHVCLRVGGVGHDGLLEIG